MTAGAVSVTARLESQTWLTRHEMPINKASIDTSLVNQIATSTHAHAHRLPQHIVILKPPKGGRTSPIILILSLATLRAWEPAEYRPACKWYHTKGANTQHTAKSCILHMHCKIVGDAPTTMMRQRRVRQTAAGM
jgi:hypothetical protein